MKRFLCFLLTMILFILIVILSFSFSLKEVVINTLSEEVVENKIANETIDTLKDVYSNLDLKVLDKLEENIKNSDFIYDITSKYLDNISNNILSDEEVKNIDINSYIGKILDENKDILEENDISVTEENINRIKEELENNDKLDKIYKNVVSKLKNNITDEEKDFIKTYNKISTLQFRITIISLIIITVLLLAFIKKTYYKWTYNAAIALILSGSFLSFIIPLTKNIIVDIISSKTSLISNININSLVNSGYICFLLSILFIIIYFVLNKITHKNEM